MILPDKGDTFGNKLLEIVETKFHDHLSVEGSNVTEESGHQKKGPCGACFTICGNPHYLHLG